MVKFTIAQKLQELNLIKIGYNSRYAAQIIEAGSHQIIATMGLQYQ